MKKIKFDYSWVIVGICFMMIMTSLGLCSSGRTHYLTAITKALDIPRGAFSINDTFRFVTTTVVNLYLGKLIAKFGTKKLICAGISLLTTIVWLLYWFAGIEGTAMEDVLGVPLVIGVVAMFVCTNISYFKYFGKCCKITWFLIPIFPIKKQAFIFCATPSLSL